jgi:hypothetical protein
MFIAALMLAMLLSACGGAGSTPAATPVPVATPEERVKGFFDTFSAAINDPEISDPARQSEWVERLVDFAPPAEREQASSQLASSLAEFGGMNLGEMIGQEGLDIRLEMTFAITETRLVEESGDRAQVEVVNGMISMQPVGADVEQLGEMAAMMTQEVPISEFFADSDNADRLINLVKIDGVWYLEEVLNLGV